jgi:hypothetical protein
VSIQPRSQLPLRQHVLLEFLLLRLVPILAANGIGGEYSAINSAIDELIPPWRRSWIHSRSTAPGGGTIAVNPMLAWAITGLIRIKTAQRGRWDMP